LINAIAHKDYASGIPIQISVYDDKLMIWNPGQLPLHWTLDLLTAKHASVPYNPDIASVFFRASLLESWGRGIDLIRQACMAHGSPEPRFRWDNGLWVELPFMAMDEGRTTQETTQEQILALLQAEPALTPKALSERIGLSTDGIKYHLDKLKKAGAIRRKGSTKSGHWEVLK
jgi:Predicted transcriptional regulator containing an HTH domain and an uncharacterized domain shared with the mammalian protein Schlafen